MLPWLIIALVCFATYANSLGGQFVFDDHPQILNRLTELQGPIGEALEHSRRPLVTLTLMANAAIGGSDPIGYHIFNVLVHLAASIVLFEIVIGALAIRGCSANSVCMSLLIALLWMVHPLHTESVTYIIQRAESMAVLCMLIVLLSLLQLAKGRSFALWVAVAVLASLSGMASKATMVSAPVIALLFDGLVLSTSIGAALRVRWGVHAALLMTTAMLLATGVVGGVLHGDEEVRASVGLAVPTVSATEYLRSQPEVVLHYVWQVIWPSQQTLDWGWPIATNPWKIAITSVVMLALVAVVASGVLKRRAWAFPAAAALIWLIPTSSVIPLRDLAVEHRMYGPTAGIAVLLVCGVGSLVHSTSARRGSCVIAVIIIGIWSLLTIQRNTAYSDPVGLWESARLVTPDNARVRMSLAVALYEDGRTDEAIALLDDVVAEQPSNAMARFNLGLALHRLGKSSESLQHLGLAARALGTNEVLLTYAAALCDAGFYRAAVLVYREAERPDLVADTFAAMAMQAEQEGDLVQAIAHYQSALDAEPTRTELRDRIQSHQATLQDSQ